MNEHNIINRAKQHIKDNKAVYITGGICLVAGVVGGVVVCKKAAAVNVRPIQALTYKSTMVTEVHVEALGDPGDIIQDLSTGSIYASQGQAARELGLDRSAIGHHLAGRTPHVKGHRFEKIGKAHVSESVAA